MTIAPGSLYRIVLSLRSLFTADFWDRLGRRPPGLGAPFEDIGKLAINLTPTRLGGEVVFLAHLIWYVGNSLSLLFSVLAICAFPVLSMLLGNALLFIGQGQEFLREYGVSFIPTGMAQRMDAYASLPLLLALIAWSLTNWYCARQLLAQAFRVPREFAGFLPGQFGRLIKKYFPRLLGLLSLLPITLAYPGITAPGSEVTWRIYALLALAVVFFYDWIFHRDSTPRKFSLVVLLAGLALSIFSLAILSVDWHSRVPAAQTGLATSTSFGDGGWFVLAAYLFMLFGILYLFKLRTDFIVSLSHPSIASSMLRFHRLKTLAAWGMLLAGILLFMTGRQHPEQLTLLFLLAFATTYGFMGWRRLLWPKRFRAVLRHTKFFRDLLVKNPAPPTPITVSWINAISPQFISNFVQALTLALNKAVYDLRRRGVGIGTLVILLGLNTVFFALMWGITLDPIRIGVLLRAIPIGLLALSGITLFGSLSLYLLPKALGLPNLLLIPPLLAILAGQSVDNHSLPDVVPHAAARYPGTQRPLLAEHFLAWQTQRAADKDFPIFIVAAAGGGHRAAVWSAEVLSRLEDATCGEFSRHVYAISGVSGGALGAASFVASLAEHGSQAPGMTPGCWHRSDRSKHISAFYASDFISPTLAYMLFPDLLQRFWPEPIFLHDRAWALESTWESAWAATRPESGLASSPNWFKEPFLSLYAQRGKTMLPLLFFNSTSVEEGKRAIASPVFSRHEDTYDLLASDLVTGDIKLSTTVHNSARFSYVSPAGTVHKIDAEVMAPDTEKSKAITRWGRVVDGGYFENSGAATAREILEQLAFIQAHRRNLYIILISNEPRDPAQRICGSPQERIPRSSEATKLPVKEPPPDRPLLPELSAPLGALSATREARGTLAEVDLVNAVGSCGQVFEVYLAKNDQIEFSDPALGWFLSSASLANIDNALLSSRSASNQPARHELERIAARILHTMSGKDANLTTSQLRQMRLAGLCKRIGQAECSE